MKEFKGFENLLSSYEELRSLFRQLLTTIIDRRKELIIIKKEREKI